MSEYCRSKAAPEGSNLYYACMYQPEPARQRLYALFALYYELLDSVFGASDPGVCRIKLAWWREELERLAAEQPRHPVAEALQVLTVDDESLLDLPETVETLLTGPDADSGWHHAGCVAPFWRRAARAAGPAGETEQAFAVATGTALARLEMLQNLRRLLELGFNPLPRERLEETGLAGDVLLHEPGSAATRRLTGMLVKDIHNELQDSYRAARGQNGRHMLFVLILNRLAEATCREILRDDSRLLEHRIALPPLRKLGIAFRTKYARLVASYKPQATSYK